MVGKSQDNNTLHRILVGVDGSENSIRAVKLASEIAQREGSDLIVLSIVSFPNDPMVFGGMALNSLDAAYRDYADRLAKMADGYVENAMSLAKSQGVTAKGKVEEAAGSVVHAIVAYAEGEKVDLIVVGTRGIGGFKKLVLGSVSSGVVSHAHCPVLVVR